MNGLALCAGVGGLELGIERVFPNFRNVAFVEGEAFAASNLVKKMEEGSLAPAPIWSDLRTFEGGRFRGKVDLISAGFPCQPFSYAGRLQGTEDSRHLWPHVSRIIGEVRPSIVVLENVPGVLSVAGAGIFADMAKMGFNCAWGIVRASEAGAHHQRARFFAVCVADADDGFNHNQDQEICSRRTSSFDGGSAMADADHQRSQKSALPDSGREKIPDIERCREELADTDRSRCRQSHQEIEIGTPEQPNGDCLFIPDPNGQRLERRVQDIIFDQKGRKVSGLRCISEPGYRRNWDRASPWAPEPGVGRVVDGVADWVDRIRACGNGVVPQQAELAIRVLLQTLIDRRSELN